MRDQRGGASIGGQPCDAGAIQTSAPATTTQYAYAGGGATDPASCLETTNSATQCTLDLVYGADSIMLMTPGIEGTPSSYFNANLSSRLKERRAPIHSPSSPVLALPIPSWTVADLEVCW